MQLSESVKIVLATVLVCLAHVCQGTTVANETGSCFCLRQAAGHLHNPVAMLPLRDGSQLIVEQRGAAWRLSPQGPDSRRLLMLNITDRVLSSPQFGDERGLLGVALHPEYPTPSTLYAFYSRQDQGQHHTYVSEFSLTEDVADVTSERVLLRIPQPHARGNGGQLLFGTDGFLYVFVGHGGESHDPTSAYAQNPRSFLGKVLRIDVGGRGFLDGRPLPYGIPTDNPWVANSSWLPEIFATGARNMWRCSQDMAPDASGHHRIFCGDTGESSFEEVNIIEKGRNYGWNLKEGLSCFNRTKCDGIEREGVPIYVFEHAQGGANAVVGGYVYRGDHFPALRARYVFGDVMQGDVFLLREGESGWVPTRWAKCAPHRCPCQSREDLRTFLLSFAQDRKGELYVLTTPVLNAHDSSGVLLTLVPPVTDSSSLTCGVCTLPRFQLFHIWAGFLTLSLTLRF